MLHKCPAGALTTRSGRASSQNADEFWTFLRLLKARGVKSYLEIGSRDGDALAWVIEHLQPERVTAVDLPGACWGLDDSLVNLQAVIAAAQGAGIDAALILGDSKAADVIAAVAQRGPFDAIFIDGDHTYAGAQADWLNYRGLTRDIFAFHDIFGHHCTWRGVPVEVPRLWAEARAQYAGVAIGNRTDSPMGIGAVFMGERYTMQFDGKMVMIYGDDTGTMKEIARQLRIDGHTVGLRSIDKWQGDHERCDHVLMIAEHNGIAEMYAALGVPVELIASEPDDDAEQLEEVRGDIPAPDGEPDTINDNAADEQAAAPAPKRKGGKKAAK